MRTPDTATIPEMITFGAKVSAGILSTIGIKRVLLIRR
jgi:hypothetical protein